MSKIVIVIIHQERNQQEEGSRQKFRRIEKRYTAEDKNCGNIKFFIRMNPFQTSGSKEDDVLSQGSYQHGATLAQKSDCHTGI
jgi:hypothetical protein